MSFSAEMKDFIAAYQTGQKINASRTDQDYKEARTEAEKKKTARDNDPETLKIATDQAKATLARTKDAMLTSASARESAAQARENSRAQAGYTNANTAIRQHQLKLMQQPDPGTGLMPTAPLMPTLGADGQPLPAGAPVLPVGPSTLDDGTELYAEGGLVEDDEPDEEGVLDTTPMPAAPPTDVSARARQPGVPKGLEGIVSPALVQDAAREGMTWGIEKAGLHSTGAIKSPAAQLKAKQIAQGMGGLSEEEMQAAKKAVDPEGKLTESQRNMAALGSVYQFWANKGEPEKARKVAFQMLQSYRGASQRYAAIAAKAAEGGNVDLATKAALKAYQNVPDGNDLELLPNPDGGIMYAITGPNGDVITKGVATPQQLAASAMGLATGGFDKAILSAAGAAQADTGAVKTGGKTQTSSDRAKEAESIGGEIEKMKTAWTAKNKDKPVDDEQWNEIANAAQHIYQQNPKATANEVARAAHAMLSMGDDPEKPGFKVKPGEEGKPSTVDFGGKLKVQLDDDQLESILNARAARVKTATDEIDKKMTESEQPGFADKALEAGKTIASGVSKLPTPGAVATDAVKAGVGAVGGVLDKIYGQHIPEGVLDVVPTELRQRVTSDLRKIDSLIRRSGSNPMQNQGAIPVDDGDRPL
jgi:hypothetical protein